MLVCLGIIWYLVNIVLRCCRIPGGVDVKGSIGTKWVDKFFKTNNHQLSSSSSCEHFGCTNLHGILESSDASILNLFSLKKYRNLAITVAFSNRLD